MDDTTQRGTVYTVGVAVTLLSVAGYVAGVYVPYPGRAFSVTGLMVGVTLAAIGRGLRSGGGR